MKYNVPPTLIGNQLDMVAVPTAAGATLEIVTVAVALAVNCSLLIDVQYPRLFPTTELIDSSLWFLGIFSSK